MTREYALIGLVVGIIVGAVAMRFGNRKLRQQQALQYELEKNKAELEEYREELVSHFARSAELLDTMAHDYRQLYQHMAKSSSSLLPELSAESNPFRNRLAESEAGNDQLRYKCRVTTPKAHPACCVVAQSATNRTAIIFFWAQRLRPPLLSRPDYHLIIIRIVSRLKIQ